uniref:Iron-sulfur cluster insertion protein n=1 Tax=Candidatus Kentrum sp. TUN TaxID=2126343 RepID=A0A450ZPD2_9GAMM|nr:MAG: iron-sulfur cluster insertion protein [Candidatus Kentron sp. TUN]VFK60274.1 MAG: iron-sulfur cluster insertion protein [Candidatus Kentron sp. TUN]VFK61708.1 MAG: iron-sulfur cluster insertion protein [Candidatus Kentron sp. TUN]
MTDPIPQYDATITEEEFKITPSAREQLAKIFQENRAEYEEIEAIRVFVVGGGCSGMAYGMTFTDHQTGYDKVIEDSAFKIYVDAIALNYLYGVEIDYVQRPSGPSFVFNNVFALTGGSGSCGSCCSTDETGGGGCSSGGCG